MRPAPVVRRALGAALASLVAAGCGRPSGPSGPALWAPIAQLAPAAVRPGGPSGVAAAAPCTVSRPRDLLAPGEELLGLWTDVASGAVHFALGRGGHVEWREAPAWDAEARRVAQVELTGSPRARAFRGVDGAPYLAWVQAGEPRLSRLERGELRTVGLEPRPEWERDLFTGEAQVEVLDGFGGATLVGALRRQRQEQSYYQQRTGTLELYEVRTGRRREFGSAHTLRLLTSQGRSTADDLFVLNAPQYAGARGPQLEQVHAGGNRPPTRLGAGPTAGSRPVYGVTYGAGTVLDGAGFLLLASDAVMLGAWAGGVHEREASRLLQVQELFANGQARTMPLLVPLQVDHLVDGAARGAQWWLTLATASDAQAGGQSTLLRLRQLPTTDRPLAGPLLTVPLADPRLAPLAGGEALLWTSAGRVALARCPME